MPILGLSTVALTNVVTAIGGSVASRFLMPMIPTLGIPYEGELMMVAGIGGAIVLGKSLKGWGKIFALIICGVIFGAGLLKSTFLSGGIGGEV